MITSQNNTAPKTTRLAAERYDAQGRANGAKLDRAVTAPAFSDEEADRVARYKASKLSAGDVAGFAAECGAFAANSVVRSLNGTILKNVRRDKKRGVRYARVTSGRNTCAFCLMLAGRGAVYWTRESAGALNRWHNHCTCKVVPCYSGDAKEVLVEGHDPAKIEARLKEVERLTGTKRGTSEFEREIKLRDPDWLFGDEMATDYSLNPMENYGRLLVPGDYSPENIVERGNEWRDLWAHHVLEVNGIKAQTHGGADIDLTINSEWWEVKSPDEPNQSPKPGRELSYIESNLRSAVKQFKKRGIGDECKVVLNLKYRLIGDVPISEIRRQMEMHGIKEILVIDTHGLVAHL